MAHAARGLLLAALLMAAAGCSSGSIRAGAPSEAAAAGVVQITVPYFHTDKRLFRADVTTTRYRAGTGVYLGPGRVATAHHVLFAGQPTRQQLRQGIYIAPAGQNTTAGVNTRASGGTVRSVPALDVAMLTHLPAIAGVAPAQLTRRRPKVGDRITAWGMGGGELRQFRGRIVQWSVDGRWLAVTPQCKPGDSGGPVFDDDGRLIGLIVGQGPRHAPFSVELQPGDDEPLTYHHRTYGEFDDLGKTSLVIDLTQVSGIWE